MNGQDKKKLPPKVNIKATCKNCYLRETCDRYKYNRDNFAKQAMEENHERLSRRDLKLIHIVIANDCKYYRMDFGIIIQIIWHKAKKAGMKIMPSIKIIKKLSKELSNGV